VTGTNVNGQFPTVDAVQPTFGGVCDAFLARLSPNGDTLFEATYWGGSAQEVGYDVGVDGQGIASLVGLSYSADFPVSSGAFQDTFAGGADVFVSRITPVPTVTVTASAPNASETGPTAGAFTLTRSGDLSDPLTVNYVIGGTA